ncbi:MAG: J domain-containing protein [Treponemataceae bacterium]
MKDHYEILGVSPFASISEIKHSFRQKAKLLHPDLNIDAGEEQNKKMHRLLEAYHYLLEQHKNFVEQDFFINKRVKDFNYRKWLLERDDYESRAKLIVFDLLHEKEKSALAEYLRLLNLELPFKFSKYFSRYDFMDYGFILAEELYFEKHYYEAFILLHEICLLEKKDPYFTHFFPEVIQLTKKCLNGLKPNKDRAKVFTCYKMALNLQFTKSQKMSFKKEIEKILQGF